MKIKTGSYVKVKPSTCRVSGLKPETPYLVTRAKDPPGPMGMRNGKPWTPAHTVTIEDHLESYPDEQKKRWSNLKELHIEDCIDVTPKEMAPPKRTPVDRVAVLLRLRRDHCLKHGRYPTVDQAARQEAREQARALFYADSREIWDFADEMKFLVEAKLAAFGLKPEEVSDLGTLSSNKAIDGLIDSLKSSSIRDTQVREYLLDKDQRHNPITDGLPSAKGLHLPQFVVDFFHSHLASCPVVLAFRSCDDDPRALRTLLQFLNRSSSVRFFEMTEMPSEEEMDSWRHAAARERLTVVIYVNAPSVLVVQARRAMYAASLVITDEPKSDTLQVLKDRSGLLPAYFPVIYGGLRSGETVVVGAPTSALVLEELQKKDIPVSRSEVAAVLFEGPYDALKHYSETEVKVRKQRDLAKHQTFGYAPRMFPKG